MILTISDDFNLSRIAESGQCFRWEKLSAERYRILNGTACLYAETLGDHRFQFSCSETEFNDIWYRYFDLDQDYTGIRARISKKDDFFLWSASEQEKGIRILRQDPWEMLITFIISQNRNIPSIRRSVDMLSRTCGELKTDVLGETYYAFPAPSSVASLDKDALIACRLGYRWKYVLAAARATASGIFDPDRLKDEDDATVTEVLTALYGVGAKVADCVSLFGFHRINAFPKDVWIKKILSEQYPSGYPFDLYSPYNGIYQQYMFAYYRNRPASVLSSEGSIGSMLYGDIKSE